MREFILQRSHPWLIIKQWCKLILNGIAGFILFLCLSVLPYLAQTPTQPKTVHADNSQAELKTPQELEEFLDKFFAEQMPELHIPGAVVAFVKDREVFLTKGYGYADLEKKTPITPDTTLFRVGSVSKLFTATAVMQLVDRGLLNLDDDVNKYLKHFQLERNYPEPIRVKHLLSHTSGFSQHYIGIAAETEAQMLPLAEYVAKYNPPRVRSPGILYSYSIYNSDLLGYLVEVISGVPFAQYIEENILQPLNMHRSSFLQPPPLASNLAVGYEYEDGNYEPLPLLYLNVVPAGGMSATATDMTHFMLAHLQNGRYGNERILSEKSAQAMRQQQFTDHPKLPGIGYAFHERFKNQQRVLAHSAIFHGYTGLLSLIPEQNLGIFITYNSFEPKLHERLVTQFLDQFYPVPEEPEPPKPLAGFQERTKRFTGTYRDIEYPAHTLAKISSLFGHVSVREGENGTLTVNFPEGFFATIPPQDDATKLLEVEPLVFYRFSDDDYVVFAENGGNITYMFHPLDLGSAGFEKLPWYETTYFLLPLAGFFLVAFLSALWMWPIKPLIRRFCPGSREKRLQTAKLAWLAAGLIGTLYLAFLVGMGLTFWLLEPINLIYGVPSVMRELLFIPLIAAGLTVALVIFSVLAWKNKYWSIRRRSHYSLITLAALGFIPFLNYWNLLGFRF